MGTVETGLNDRLASLVLGMGYEFVGCEWHRDGRDSSLRLYVDKLGGVTVTDCTDISRQVGSVLDVEELVRGHYCLEVSSPGVNRPLFTLAQYQQFAGQEVNIRLHTPHEGRRQLKGRLLWAKDQAICVQLPEEERVVPFVSVARGNLVVEVFQKKSRSGGAQTGSRKRKAKRG